MQWKRFFGYHALLLVALAGPLALMGFKLFVLEYPMADLIPMISYRVDLSIQVDGHGEDVEISTYLPISDDHQIVGDELNISGRFAQSLVTERNNRIATWQADALEGRHNLVYTFSVQPNHIRYTIPDQMPIPTAYPDSFREHLKATEGIQVDDPLIAKALQQILPGENPGVRESLWSIHRYLQDQLANHDFSGYTDALTALKLGEGSCNGKSRLFAAMARRINLPARLIGGLILAQGSKRVTHQWLEVYINGHWVPFDTINDHFAEIPANYMTLYYGDLVMFRHTSNVNFKYFYKMTKRLVPRREVEAVVQGSPLNIMNLYAVFERVGISQNLLKIILLLPFGALVTVISRNVIGLETFGTFLPALIAAAARETGFWWGAFGFIIIILSSALVRRLLDRLQLLHSPKMAIILTVVILTMLGMTVLGVHVGAIELAHITLFPIAILAITAERFALIQSEQGFAVAVRRLFVTLVVVGACYAVMSSVFLQSLLLVFPELLVVVIGLDLWLGRWSGMRVAELFRFRRLIREAGR